jgi:integrase
MQASTLAPSSKPQKRKPVPGIVERHSRTCRGHQGGNCNCEPSYRAFVWDKRAPIEDADGNVVGHGKKLFKTFPTLAAAKSWRQDAMPAVKRRELAAPGKPITLRQAAMDWLEGAKTGAIRTRSGDRYKPSTLHGYEQVLKSRVLRELGAVRLHDITGEDLQALAERMLAEGLDPSTIRNTLMPLGPIYRRHCKKGQPNPMIGLELPAVRGVRDRIVDPAEAARLIDELPERDRALWAMAVYAGLRRGELLALRWADVDLAAGVIRVERSYDPRSGQTGEPKSRAGIRKVPIAAVLRDHLDEHKLRRQWEEGLVFGRAAERPFNHSTVIARAATAWRKARRDNAGQEGASEEELAALDKEPFDALTLHEARHTYASLMIAAGVNAKALSTYMGHSSIQITLDRYGHLFPGNEDEAAGLLDTYLEAADTKARLAQLEATS